VYRAGSGTYWASQEMSVVLRDLTSGGKAIGAAIEAGGNAVSVGGVTLGIGAPAALTDEARGAAFADAKAKAEQYARLIGRPLGRLVLVQEGEELRERYVNLSGGLHAAKASAGAADAAVPIAAGTERVQVSNKVVWELG
jgi:uncharacterized protein YggE